MSNKNTLRLVESGLLIAIGIILDTFFKFEAPWAYGGSITLCAMLPMCIIAYKHGVLWGALSGVAHGLITMLISGFRAGGLAAMIEDNGGLVLFFWIVLFDYILAFAAIGLGGFARKFAKNAVSGLSLCAVIGLTGRYLMHCISGYLFFAEYAEWFFEQSSWGQAILEKISGTALSIVYTLVYNGLYMIPEIIITAVAAVLVGKFLGRLLENSSAQA